MDIKYPLNWVEGISTKWSTEFKDVGPIEVPLPCICPPRGTCIEYSSIEGMMASMRYTAKMARAGGCGGRHCPWSKPLASV